MTKVLMAAAYIERGSVPKGKPALDCKKKPMERKTRCAASTVESGTHARRCVCLQVKAEVGADSRMV